MVSEEKIHIRHCLLFLYDCMNAKPALIQGGGNQPLKAFTWINSAYGEGTVSLSQCQRRFAKFEKGDRDLDDAPREGRPTIIDDTVLKKLVEKDDDELTIRELAETLNCHPDTVCDHLHKIGKVWKLGHWVPHMLSVRDKKLRVEAATKLLHRYQQKGELKLDDIVTGDETWVFYINPERKHHWVDVDKTPAPTPKPGLHPKKIQLSVFWCARGVIWWDLLPAGTSIN